MGPWEKQQFCWKITRRGSRGVRTLGRKRKNFRVNSPQEFREKWKLRGLLQECHQARALSNMSDL